MAGSVNKVILVGRLGSDPEVRTNQSGAKIVGLSVATSEVWYDKASGERRERTEWHRVVVFNERLAGVAERFLRKGSSVYLEGALQTRKWTDKNGVVRYSTEVVLDRFRGELVLLDKRQDSQNGPAGGGYDRQNSSPNNQPSGGWDAPQPNYNLDSDIPF